MTEGPLTGVGVLVTRPRRQSDDLVAAIEAAGGNAVRFPVLEIVPRDAADVAADAAELAAPDIVVFISSNAVEHGMAWADDARIAAIGPATAAAVEQAGRTVEISPRSDFDSEALLAEPDLQQPEGLTIRIIRGSSTGRELLGDTLRDRGATVDYLSTYDRRLPGYSAGDIAALEDRWRAGGIDVVTVMSVESLDNLFVLLPAAAREMLSATPLVSPAARVIKEAQNRFPDSKKALVERTLADRTLADRTFAERTLVERTVVERTVVERTLGEDMVRAIVTLELTTNGNTE